MTAPEVGPVAGVTESGRYVQVGDLNLWVVRLALPLKRRSQAVPDSLHPCTLIPRGRLMVIPDCGHCPHLEQPGAFAAAVDAFLCEE